MLQNYSVPGSWKSQEILRFLFLVVLIVLFPMGTYYVDNLLSDILYSKSLLVKSFNRRACRNRIHCLILDYDVSSSGEKNYIFMIFQRAEAWLYLLGILKTNWNMPKCCQCYFQLTVWFIAHLVADFSLFLSN